MISMLDPEVKATEIHRNTPFEFEATAEPQQFVQGCAQPVPFESPKAIEVVLVNGSSGKWGGGDAVGTFRIPNLLPVRLSI